MLQKRMHSNTEGDAEKRERLLHGRLPVSSPAGHWLIPWGAVGGADERYRGAGIPKELRRANDNPVLHDPEVMNWREAMEKSLNAILGDFPLPRSLPVVFVCCRISGKIYQYLPFEDICVLKVLAA